jgi:hypothetical protein
VLLLFEGMAGRNRQGRNALGLILQDFFLMPINGLSQSVIPGLIGTKYL